MAMQRVSRGKVEAVTVFRAGAAVTRQISLEGLGADVRELRIAPLPLALDDDSVRPVGARGNKRPWRQLLQPSDRVWRDGWKGGRKKCIRRVSC